MLATFFFPISEVKVQVQQPTSSSSPNSDQVHLTGEVRSHQFGGGGTGGEGGSRGRSCVRITYSCRVVRRRQDKNNGDGESSSWSQTCKPVFAKCE